MSFRKYFFTSRFTKKGKLDWSYGTGGFSMALLSYSGDYNWGYAGAPAGILQKDGRVLVGGWATGESTPKHAWLIRMKKHLRAKDYDGKMSSDLLWRTSNGEYIIWYMNQQGKKESSKNIGGKNLLYKFTGDFNGDGISDILWSYGKHHNKYLIWYLDQRHDKKRVKKLSTNGKKVVAVGDFNGDGTDDIILKTSTDYTIWFMGQKGKISEHRIDGAEGKIVAAFDNTGDHVTDVLALKDGIYTLWAMRMDGVIYKFPIWDASTFEFGGAGDFDGDGLEDILFKLKEEGRWGIWCQTSGSVMDLIGEAKGLTPVSVGDFDGDGFADIIWRKTKGGYVLWLMSPWPSGTISIKKKIQMKSEGMILVN